MSSTSLHTKLPQTPFEALILTNSAAKKGDTMIIWDLVHQVEPQIEYWNGIVSQHSRIVEDAIKQRDRFIAFRDDHLRLMRTALRVPQEIWAAIFRLICVSFLDHTFSPAEDSPKHMDSLLPHNPVSIISRVCPHWRNIIQSLPQMWCRLLLKESCFMLPIRLREEASIHDALISNLSKYLSFSHTLPLHIIIDIRSSDNTNPPSRVWWGFIRSAMRLLLEHRNRWARIDIYDSKEATVQRVLSRRSSACDTKGFPLLEEISLSWTPNSTTHSIPPVPFPNLSTTLPKLRYAQFEGRCPGPDSLPWNRLEKVDFIGILPQDYYRILNHLVGAKEIIKTKDDLRSLIFFPPNNPAMLSGFTLPLLETLSMHSRWDGIFYSAAKLPSLHKILVKYANAEDLLAVVEFVQKTLCKPTHFKCRLLESHTKPTRRLAQLLSLMPSLTLLDTPYHQMGTHSRDDDLIALLNLLMERSGQTFTHCPDLQDMRIDIAYFKDPELVDTTVRLIEMRWAAGVSLCGEPQSGLRRVGAVDPYIWDHVLEFPDAIRGPYERLKRMEEEGLQISLMKFDLDL